MAGFFQQALQGVVQGFFNDAYLRDFKHASKTFTTNGFANAPKFKYLFHVYFELNHTLTGMTPATDMNPGILVKSITLPKFSVSVSEMNQYNRKRNIQTKITYDPVSITFHDDNAGQIKKMWYDYYSYYYNDVTSSAKNVNTDQINNKYVDDISGNQQWGYSGEPSYSTSAAAIDQSKPAFFKSIKIFGFNQHNFSGYTLINPMIERFEHDTYDYYQTNSTMENRMTIKYESVTYEEGAINGKNPELIPGFGSDAYYDKTLSPISKPGGNKTVMGQGGLVDAGLGIIGDLGSGNIGDALVKGLNVTKTWKNPDAILTAVKSELVSGAVAAVGNPQTLRSAFTFATAPSSNNIKQTGSPPLPNGGQ